MIVGKFNSGDKVKVIDNIEVKKLYGDYSFIKEMEQYKNKILTIAKYENTGYTKYYDIIEDNGQWSWTEGMFELVGEYESKTIDCIDIVLEKLGLQLGEDFEIDIYNKETWIKYKIKKDGLYNSNLAGDFKTSEGFVKLLSGQIPYRKIKPIKQPTEEEQKVLDAAKVLGINWVTKDNNGECYFYTIKPSKNQFSWSVENMSSYIDACMDFSFLSWKDEEPYEIK